MRAAQPHLRDRRRLASRFTTSSSMSTLLRRVMDADFAAERPPRATRSSVTSLCPLLLDQVPQVSDRMAPTCLGRRTRHRAEQQRFAKAPGPRHRFAKSFASVRKSAPERRRTSAEGHRLWLERTIRFAHCGHRLGADVRRGAARLGWCRLLLRDRTSRPSIPSTYTHPKHYRSPGPGSHFLNRGRLGRLDQCVAVPSLSRDIYSDIHRDTDSPF